MNFKDYHGYKFYDNGVVIGKMGKALAGSYNRKGYPVVGLWLDDKVQTKTVHRLIGELFLPNFKGLPTIHHKDKNRKNNSLYNLEWATYRDQAIERNMMCNNTSGVVGVSFRNWNQKWEARINISSNKRISKQFETKEEAIKQRKEWELEYYQK